MNWLCRGRLLLCLALAGALAGECFAAEGFFIGKRPPAVSAIWPSVYAYVCRSRQSLYVASAFFVGKLAKPSNRNRADYYFVTAGHAIEECQLPRRYLAENINQRRSMRPSRLTGPKTVYIDDTYDIAVVKIEASIRLRIGKPVPVDGKCDRALDREIYAIGFPGVTTRRSLRLKREVKRWSKGTFVGLGIADFHGVEATYIAATVDSLPGSSGGPVVDASGALIGVVAKGASGKDNNFRYDVDPNDPRDWQTFLVPCDAVLGILLRSGVR